MNDLTIPNIVAGILFLVMLVPVYCLARRIGKNKRIKNDTEDL
jgi:hypothetical protein